MRARYYNVDIKRFINQDVLTGTLERISGLNRYSYVEGNLVSYLDPFGLEIAMLQTVVNFASTMVGMLWLLKFIAPQTAFDVSSILFAITLILGIKEYMNIVEKKCSSINISKLRTEQDCDKINDEW